MIAAAHYMSQTRHRAGKHCNHSSRALAHCLLIAGDHVAAAFLKKCCSVVAKESEVSRDAQCVYCCRSSDRLIECYCGRRLNDVRQATFHTDYSAIPAIKDNPVTVAKAAMGKMPFRPSPLGERDH